MSMRLRARRPVVAGFVEPCLPTKIKSLTAPAVRREAEAEWGR
jgi:hypothetical protein